MALQETKAMHEAQLSHSMDQRSETEAAGLHTHAEEEPLNGTGR